MEWYVGVLKKYAVFTGRARRKEYWMFVLFNVLISVGLSIVDGIIGTGKYKNYKWGVASNWASRK